VDGRTHEGNLVIDLEFFFFFLIFFDILRKGIGKCTFDDGVIFEGEVKGDKLEGKGTMKNKAGDIYEGDFKNDLKEGKGVYTWSEKGRDAGRVFDGEYKNSKRHGVGIHTYPNGQISREVWKNGDFVKIIDLLQKPTKKKVRHFIF
jgi:hypothetical protein